MNGHSIRLDNVTCAFGGKRVIDDFSLSIEPGEFVAFIGPSGCGKTTTLRLIAGLEQPVGGQVFIDGKDVTYAKPWDRETPMVWQNFALFPYLDVASNVAFGLRCRGVPEREVAELVEEALSLVGIADLAKRRISQISGGQKQRAGIARALVLRPKVLLLDEPLSALDANLRLRLQGELRALHRRLGVTFVYVTHYQNEAFSLADRVVVMNGGRIEQMGPPVEIFRHPRTRFVAEFVGINNVFRGTVVDRDAAHTSVDAPFGRCLLPRVNRMAGSKVEFVIAADVISLTPAGMGPVPATISGIDVSDTLATILATTESGAEFRIQKPVLELAGLTAGQAVSLQWQPDQCHVLAPDEPAQA